MKAIIFASSCTVDLSEYESFRDFCEKEIKFYPVSIPETVKAFCKTIPSGFLETNLSELWRYMSLPEDQKQFVDEWIQEHSLYDGSDTLDDILSDYKLLVEEWSYSTKGMI
jgi:hypothetical protein